MNDLHEADVYALLTDLRDSLRSDGYEMSVVAVSPQVSLAIEAGPDACEDCLVGKELMARHISTALNELDPSLSFSDISLTYPGEVGAAEEEAD